MKKFLALVLALIMTFSLATVGFAADAETPADTATTVAADAEEEAGALDWLLDLPFWTVGPALKFASIALKLVKVFVKIAMIFGIIDSDAIVDQIIEMIKNAEAPAETTAAATTPAPVLA